MCAHMCTYVLMKNSILFRKKISFSPFFSFFSPPPHFMVCADVFLNSLTNTKDQSITLRNVLTTSMHTRIVFKCGCLLLDIVQFHHHPPCQAAPPSLSPQKEELTTQRRAIQSKVVLTIYTIQLQRSILAGLVHFVQGICIFLWDENAIN